MRLAENVVAFLLLVNTFNITPARMLDNIYHITVRLLKNLIKVRFCYRRHFIAFPKSVNQ